MMGNTMGVGLDPNHTLSPPRVNPPVPSKPRQDTLTREAISNGWPRI